MTKAKVPIPDEALVPGLRVRFGTLEGVVVQGFGERLGDGFAIVRWSGKKETVDVKELEVAGSVREALEKGSAEERVLVVAALKESLATTRFKTLEVRFVKPGVYHLGDLHKVALQWANGGLLIHGYFDAQGHLHPTRCDVRSFLEDHSVAKAAADDSCDLFGGGSDDMEKGKQRNRSRSPRNSSASALPAGWQKRESRSKPGVFYYVHSSGKTQFERPRE
eukprot:TRINITY_DN102693_c0_g1_i1.p1 TRINITY_DN102693_c0_g1~~TRINITY_DN102693_c0_g1_i1.p1  ORF type:complete len:221 (+),score=45.29 TRINITY_DN102693_c0_g1_i1:21-683(+)